MIKRFWNWLNNLFKSKRLRMLEEIEKKVVYKVNEREADRIILKSKVIKEMRKFLKLDAKSKYIPWTSKEREAIRFEIHNKFGDEIEKLDMRLTKHLKLVPIKRKR